MTWFDDEEDKDKKPESAKPDEGSARIGEYDHDGLQITGDDALTNSQQ